MDRVALFDRDVGVLRVVAGMAGALLLAACENPQPPVSCRAIPEQTVVVGEGATVSPCFEDPNGDALSYHAVASDAGVATVSVSGSMLRVTGVSPGTSVVTVTATDLTELAGSQQFRVLVPNRAPVAVGEIESRELPAGESASVDVSAHFLEPDGQPLSYAISVSDESVLHISAAGSVVTFGGQAKGSATVTATATDPGGLSATQSFVVTVPNRTPGAVGSMPAQTVEVDAAATTDVTGFFTDPDDDDLVYTATTSSAAVVQVSVSDNDLTVTAVAKGEATVTVTATDPEALTATQAFVVTVPNRPPVATGRIESRTIAVDETGTLELSGYFSDPDGDDLIYSAVTSDEAVTGVEVDGGTLKVSAIAKGRATVTVTATDTEGLAATQAFVASVPNRPPLAAGSIEGRTIEVGGAATMVLSGHFTDPDGDDLAYTAISSDAAIVEVTVSGSDLTVMAVAKGEATVTVTATDTEGLAATQAFVATAPNRPPLAVGTIAGRTLEIGDSATLELSGNFEDPDGDDLTYSVSSSDATLIGAVAEGAAVTVEALARGRAIVTVTAADTEGLAATQTFEVTVANRPPLAVGSIAGQTIEVGETAVMELPGYFEDPDHDALAYTADSPGGSVVSAAVSGGALTVTALRKGEAAVAVTATDPEGLSATLEFAVTVPNQAPQPAGTIPAMEVSRGGIRRVVPALFFAEPDGEALVFQATSSHPNVAKAWMSANGIVVRGVARGTATVTITAEDPNGLTAAQQFGVQVRASSGSGSNRPPVRIGTVTAQTLAKGRSRGLDASHYFSDPDGDDLKFSAQSSSVAIVVATASSSRIQLEAVAEGTATVTIAARDPDGLSASMAFAVTVFEDNGPNRPPHLVGTFSAQTLDPADERAFSAASYFGDPDGDELSFSAQSSDADVVTATVSETRVTLTAVAEGTAIVAIAAEDPEGLIATADFAVTVADGGGDNRPPVVVDRVATQDLEVGDTVTVPGALLFADPDFDELTFSAKSSDEEVVEATVSGSDIELDIVDRGNATVTVTAEDPGGLSASMNFDVAAAHLDPNQPPVVTYTIEAQVVEINDTTVVRVLNLFSDPDSMERLSWSVLSSDTAIAQATLEYRTVYLRGVALGTATVTVTAEDPDGLSASLSFNVTAVEAISNRPPVVTDTVEAREVDINDITVVYVYYLFIEPDGEALSFSAVSSDTAIAQVTVEDSRVFVRGVALGTTSVVVTAQDPENATATLTFGVTVLPPNQGPVAVGTIPDVTLKVGRTVDVDMEPYFEDPDGDALRYRMVPRSEYSYDVADGWGSDSRGGYTIRAYACGTAAFAIRASDRRNDQFAYQHFDVVVSKSGPNQDPEFVQPHYTTGVFVGQSRILGLTDLYFRDPDAGDLLFYEAVPSDSAVVGVEGPPTSVTLLGRAIGETTVAITARDDCGGSTDAHSVSVIVRSDGDNGGPTVADGVVWDEFTINVGDTVSFDLNSYFTDPDGDPLVLEGLTAPSTKLDYSMSDGVMKVWGVASGVAEVAAVAMDPWNLFADLPWMTVLVTDPDEDSEQPDRSQGPDSNPR